MKYNLKNKISTIISEIFKCNFYYIIMYLMKNIITNTLYDII